MVVLQLDDSWINDLQRLTIERMLATCRYGAAWIDVVMRVDGQEYRFEADWIKSCNQGPAPYVRAKTGGGEAAGRDERAGG